MKISINFGYKQIMNLHIITLLFIIFENINSIFSQNIPLSPCPKNFQYRFDGSEWFGMLSVHNSDFSQTLHLQVTLSIRGKLTANYLGEIELLTRGQFFSEAPVVYKVKFPKTPYPPKLVQIAVNNQIVCLGQPDQGVFVTQIQLEHTRKVTFLPGFIPPPSSSLPSSTSSSSAMGMAADQPDAIPTSPITIGLKDSFSVPENIAFNTKHLLLTNTEKNPMFVSKNICGTIDGRVHFKILHPSKQRAADDTVAASVDTSSRQEREKDGLPLVVSSDPDKEIELPSITRGSWPWLAAIYVNNSTSLVYQCGGTLISARIVLSAAHCFQLFKEQYTANEVLVFLGRHNLNSWNEEGSLATPVDDIFIHPAYNKHLTSFDGDIAVVILKNEVQFSTFIRPACLWMGSTELQDIENEYGIVVGWGLNSINSTRKISTTSPVPKFISTPIVSNDVCFRANSKYQSLSSNRTFCAGIMLQNVKNHSTSTTQKEFQDESSNFKHQLHQGPCTGDSGAGLMILKNNSWKLRGIVSGSLPVQPTTDDDSTIKKTSQSKRSCSINQYVIYTDVAKFLDWILSFTL